MKLNAPHLAPPKTPLEILLILPTPGSNDYPETQPCLAAGHKEM